MTKFTEYISNKSGSVTFICDFSPPKGIDLDELNKVSSLNSDFIYVAYNPGKSVRINSLQTAHWIKQNSSSDVVFAMGCRDMNKLAIQSHLLGAQLLGLENLLIFQGDPFTPAESINVKTVMDYKSTELIDSVNMMNNKLDYKGKELSKPTDFCIGSTIDLNKDLDNEVRLTNQKVKLGANYFLLQPIFSIDILNKFLETYNKISKSNLNIPLCIGVQILNKTTKSFGKIPTKIKHQLESGKSPIMITSDFIEELLSNNFNNIYLLPSLLPDGKRGYEQASRIIKEFK